MTDLFYWNLFRLLLLLTENCAKKNDLVPSLGFLEECKQLCLKYNLQHYLILCHLYEVQLNKVSPKESSFDLLLLLLDEYGYFNSNSSSFIN